MKLRWKTTGTRKFIPHFELPDKFLQHYQVLTALSSCIKKAGSCLPLGIRNLHDIPEKLKCLIEPEPSPNTHLNYMYVRLIAVEKLQHDLHLTAWYNKFRHMILCKKFSSYQ